MSIEDIVNVKITRETRAVSRQGFSTILILGVNKAFTSLSKTYNNQNAVLEDFQSTDKEAIASSAIFAQSPSVVNIKIGRRATSDTTVITVVTVISNTLYTCKINGTDFTFDSGGSPTAASIALGLDAAINAGSEPVTSTDNFDGTYDLDADVGGVVYSVKVDANQTTAFTTIDTLANDLTAISQEDDNWYGLVYTLRVQADQEAIAAYVETQKKVFSTASDDADIKDVSDASDTTSLAAVLKSLSFARSQVIYLSNAATQFPEAALLGSILPLDPGTWTAKFKTLSGITVDSTSSTQRTNILAKNATQYTEVGGVNITEDGKVAEGEHLDIIVFVDFLDARITENVFSLLANKPKVPYTDKGITSIQSEINQVLQDGVSIGGIAEDPPFTISVPKAIDISAIDKANRELNDVKFQATLAGAIHAVNIDGIVSL